MNRFFTLVTFFLLNCELIHAQKSNVFNVPLKIDLRVSPAERLFSVDTIINARVDTVTHIGTWQKPSGKVVELRFEEGFQPTLTNFIFSVLTNFDNKLPSYSLIIKEFDLSSASGFNRFELAISFCKRNGIRQIGNTGSVDSIDNIQPLTPIYKAEIIVENSGNDFTALIKEGLTKTFLKFNNYLANPNTEPPAYSDFIVEAAKAAQALNLASSTYDSIRTDDDDLLRCSQLRPGIYQNFNDLRQNRPSLTGELSILEKNGFATIRKPSGSRDKHRFFGFCDGKDLFISTGLYQTTGLIRRYAKVKSVGRYLLWIDNYLTSSEIAANAAGASFGLIGALVASSANSYRDCIALDMQTGGVFLVTKDKLPQMLAGHDDLLTELAAIPNKKDEQQQLRLLDKLNQRSRTFVTR